MSTYPNNSLIHYYLALSCQAVGNRGQAKAEYEWVQTHDGTQLRQLAEKGLAQLGGSSGSGSAGNTQGSSGAPGAATTVAAAQSAPKTKTIIDFYTDWCGPCKRFEPVFEEVKRKHPEITFKRLNAEDAANADLVEKYGIKAYPTIVQLDGSGKVLSNESGAPSTAADFESVIRR